MNIENFGFDVDFQDVYAEFDGEDYISVLLKYKENLVYYSHQDRFNTDWLDLIQSMDYQFISGKKSLTDLIYPHFPSMKEKPMYFAEALHLDSSFEVDDSLVQRVSTEEDVGLVFDLLITIQEFGSLQNTTRDKYIEEHMRYLDNSMLLMIKEDGKVVSTAATVADTTKSAMVIAVATDPSTRNKGYASKVMIKLMDEYLNKRNKSLCLFFDNPKAGAIYHRLGFKDMDMWVMLIRKSD